VVAPFVTAPGNANETKLFPDAFNKLKNIAKAVGMNIAGDLLLSSIKEQIQGDCILMLSFS